MTLEPDRLAHAIVLSTPNTPAGESILTALVLGPTKGAGSPRQGNAEGPRQRGRPPSLPGFSPALARRLRREQLLPADQDELAHLREVDLEAPLLRAVDPHEVQLLEPLRVAPTPYVIGKERLLYPRHLGELVEALDRAPCALARPRERRGARLADGEGRDPVDEGARHQRALEQLVGNRHVDHDVVVVEPLGVHDLGDDAKDLRERRA